jgi:hypothetical protein
MAAQLFFQLPSAGDVDKGLDSTDDVSVLVPQVIDILQEGQAPPPPALHRTGNADDRFFQLGVEEAATLPAGETRQERTVSAEHLVRRETGDSLGLLVPVNDAPFPVYEKQAAGDGLQNLLQGKDLQKTSGLLVQLEPLRGAGKRRRALFQERGGRTDPKTDGCAEDIITNM